MDPFKDFKFQLGEVVCHKSNPGVRLVVYMRQLWQGPAGVSRIYNVARVHGGGWSQQDAFECELTAYEEFSNPDDD